jgi:membrane protein DedA with SNARE-associated domain
MIQQFIEHFTYAGLFLTLFAAGLGLPIPEEVAIIAGGVLSHERVVHWFIALPVCILGVLGGDVALYAIGHHWGERVLEWKMVRRVLTPEREETLKARYRQHGAKIVFAARHVMGIRAAAFLTAGICRLSFWKFVLVDAAAAIVSVPIGFGIAFLFTDQLERVMRDVHRVERWLVLYALAGLAGWLAYLAWRQSRRA